MSQIDLLQKGSIYFFYRPKVQYATAHSLDEVQRFFMVLKPEDSSNYIMLTIGRKHLPEAETYFAFVEKIAKDSQELINNLKEESYETSTRGERVIPSARCLGEGKYLLIDHDRHTHLCYKLTLPIKVKEVQEQFNLASEGDYLVSVKNPDISSPPGVGLSSKQKPIYPDKLKSKMADYRFIPLNPPDFLNFEGAEVLLIGKQTSDLPDKDPHIKKCFSEVPLEDIREVLKKIHKPESLIPLLEGQWK
jgi:hypothetical protein